MISYANLHFALERLREEAVIQNKDGPRILVLGPENAGKTSLVKLLTAYATRSGRQPVAVNLDPKESMLSIPGSLSATTFSSVIDIEEGWGSSPTNGPTPVPVKLPLVYYLGLANPEDKTSVYKPIMTRLALSVMNKLQEDTEAKGTGCIIDTPGIISQGKGGYEVVQHAVSEFSGKLQLSYFNTQTSYSSSSSQCNSSPRLRAPVQRHAPKIQRAENKRRRDHRRHQARQIRRLRRPRRNLSGAIPPISDPTVFLR